MARRDPLVKVSESLSSVIKEQVKTGFGSLRFTKKDKKTSARLYFKDGLIYGIDVSSYSPKIVTRIITNELISETNRLQVITKYGENLTDFSVIKFVLDYQLFPERPLAVYIKDFFFDALDELYQWEDVAVEWKQNDKLNSLALNITPTAPEDIITRLNARLSELNNKVAQAWALHPRELDAVEYVRNFEYSDPDYTHQLLLSLPDGAQPTIAYAADYFGLPIYNTILAVFSLWQAGAVDVIHPSGIRYSNRTDQEIRKATVSIPKPTPTVIEKPVSEPIPTITVPTYIEEEAIEEEEVDFDSFENEEPYVEQVDFVEPETVVANEELAPSLAERMEEELSYDYEPYDEPSVSDAEEETEIDEGIEDHYDEEYVEYPTEVEIVNDNDSNEPETVSTPEPEENEPITEENDMADLGLKAMAQQLRTLLAGLQKNIQETKAKIVNHDKKLGELKTRRRDLIIQLKALDVQISEENNAKTEAEKSLQEAEAELSEFTNLT